MNNTRFFTLFLIDVVLHLLFGFLLLWISGGVSLLFWIGFLSIIIDIKLIPDGTKIVAELGDQIIYETTRNPGIVTEDISTIPVYRRLQRAIDNRLTVNFFLIFKFKKINTTVDPLHREIEAITKDKQTIRWPITLNYYKNHIAAFETNAGLDYIQMIGPDFDNTMRKIAKKHSVEELEDFADFNWEQLKNKIIRDGDLKNDQFFVKLRKFGLGLDSIDTGLPVVDDELKELRSGKRKQEERDIIREYANHRFDTRVDEKKIENLLVFTNGKTFDDMMEEAERFLGVNPGDQSYNRSKVVKKALALTRTLAKSNPDVKLSMILEAEKAAEESRETIEGIVPKQRIETPNNGGSVFPVIKT